MNFEIWCNSLLKVIENIENSKGSQEIIDDLYSTICETLFSEMDKYLEIHNAKRKTRKMFKISKPYWNKNLTILWKDMCKCEKIYLKMNSCKAEKNKAFKGFKEAQNKFDKALRKAERQYNRSFIDSIETFSSKNQKNFENTLKN